MRLSVIVAMLLVCAPAAATGVPTLPLDQYGRPFDLDGWQEPRLIVVAFLGAECLTAQNCMLVRDRENGAGHAALLNKVFLRRDMKLATPKQVAWLKRTGHQHPELASFAEAKQWLEQHFAQADRR